MTSDDKSRIGILSATFPFSEERVVKVRVLLFAVALVSVDARPARAIDGRDLSGIAPQVETSLLAPEVYSWLVQHQSASGILGNQEGESFSGLYSNALAAICYLHQNDLRRAEKVFSFFQGHLNSVARQSPGGFCQFWEAASGQPILDRDRWVGDNAWLLIALNHHYYFTGENKYAEMRRTIAEWLVSLQDVDGGIMSGFNQNGLMFWKSTEGNLDCYAALIDYPVEREKIRSFLSTQMWIASEGRFRMGSTVAESALDTCSWGVAALGSDFSSALQYAESVFLRSQISDATGKLIAGFADFAAENRIWLEGTGEMALAYYVDGQSQKAEWYLAELRKGMMASTRFPGTVGLAAHTNDPAWSTGSTTIFVPSQAWYLLGAWRFNPLQYDYPHVVDLDKDGEVNVRDFSILGKCWGQDESSIDFPPPVADGRIDASDLQVLARHWLEEAPQVCLIAHWKLDETEGVVAHDDASNYDGQLQGDPEWRASGGAVDGALQFDGVNDYVKVPYVLNPSHGSFSIFAWVKTGTTDRSIVSQSGAFGARWLACDTSGRLITELKASGRGGTPLSPGSVITDDRWHRVGFTWDGAYRTLYVDDVEVAGDTSPQRALETANGDLHIGANKAASAGGFFRGVIDDVRIYSRAIKP